MISLNSARYAAALVFYLPGVCEHIDTEGKQRKARARDILKSLKKTQYLMKTLYLNWHDIMHSDMHTNMNEYGWTDKSIL